MAPARVDRRVEHLLASCRARGHRSVILLLGDSDRRLLSLLLHLALRPGADSSPETRPCVLWCHKRPGLPDGLHPHRRLVRDLRQRAHRTGLSTSKPAECLDLLQAAVDVHCCTYAQSASLLGRTFRALVLQDVAALTPNLLATTMETVAAGGVILVAAEAAGLEELAAMGMDAHARYRTPSHRRVRPLFNLRLLRSLALCPDALVLDREGRVLEVTDRAVEAPGDAVMPERKRRRKAIEKVKGRLATAALRPLIDQCETADQAKVLGRLIDSVVDSSEDSGTVVAVTAPRGRGKSAAVGLCVASALHCGYSSIWVATPTVEAVGTLLEFVSVGLRLLGYRDGVDFGSHSPQPPPEADEAGKRQCDPGVWLAVEGRRQRRRVRVLRPLLDAGGPAGLAVLRACDLLCVDEAAAIPLAVVRSMLDAVPGCPVVLASTVNGYEGTGRSLSLKLLEELRGGQKAGRPLKEVRLQEAIRYRPGDRVETWLSDLLCLDCCEDDVAVPEPAAPEACQLLQVDRTALFSGHPVAERLLRRLTALFVSSHYRNSPNDLQLLADSPSQLLFALTSAPPAPARLPDVMAVVQVALEGGIPLQEAARASAGTQRPPGDMMAWTLAQQFCRAELATRRGARVVRIAVAPELQGRGYGSRALRLLHEWCERAAAPGSDLAAATGPVWPPAFDKTPPLLSRTDDRPPPALDYLGVAFGLTPSLLRFWRRAGYRPVYVRHTRSEQTGEHSCLMVRALGEEWVRGMQRLFVRDFVRVSALSFPHLPPTLCLSLVREEKDGKEEEATAVVGRFSDHDMAQLRSYCRGQCDFHMLLKLLPALCESFFCHSLRPEPGLTLQEQCILFCMGGQGEARVEAVADSLSLSLRRPVSTGQVLGLFKRMMTRFLTAIEVLQTEVDGVKGRKRKAEIEEETSERLGKKAKQSY